ALEKRDAEELARLRQTHELSLLNAVRDIKQKQIEDAQLVIDGLTKARELAEIKRDYFSGRDLLNAAEGVALGLSAAALATQLAGTIVDTLAGVMCLIPDFKVGASGFGGSPHATVDVPSGKKIGDSTARGSNVAFQIATMLERTAAITSTLAGYGR